jgi:hypothetical protein
MDTERLGRLLMLSQLPGEVKPAGFIRRNLRRFIAAMLACLVAVGYRTAMNPKRWIESHALEPAAAPARSIEPDLGPRSAENGDRRGRDNDSDGRRESEFVEGYRRSDGTIVKGHYRAAPEDEPDYPPPRPCWPSRWPATPTAAPVPCRPTGHGERLGPAARLQPDPPRNTTGQSTLRCPAQREIERGKRAQLTGFATVSPWKTDPFGP